MHFVLFVHYAVACLLCARYGCKFFYMYCNPQNNSKSQLMSLAPFYWWGMKHRVLCEFLKVTELSQELGFKPSWLQLPWPFAQYMFGILKEIMRGHQDERVLVIFRQGSLSVGPCSQECASEWGVLKGGDLDLWVGASQERAGRSPLGSRKRRNSCLWARGPGTHRGEVKLGQAVGARFWRAVLGSLVLNLSLKITGK